MTIRSRIIYMSLPLFLSICIMTGCSILTRSYVVNHGDTPAVIEVRMASPREADSLSSIIRVVQGIHTIDDLADTLPWMPHHADSIDSTTFRVTIPPRSTAVLWEAFNVNMRGVRSVTMGSCDLLSDTCSRSESSGGFMKIIKYVIHVGE